MKVLLDHCVPKPLKNLLTGHEICHAYELGWHELQNGDLLAKAEQTFQVFVTSDKNIAHQKTWSGRKHGRAEKWPFWFCGQIIGPNFAFNRLGSPWNLRA